MINIEEHFRKWLLFACGALGAHISTFIGIFVLFLLIFIIDFFTGCAASYVKGIKIESHKLRWSAVKTFVYFGAFSFTGVAGLCVDDMEVFVGIMKMEVYVALWIELVSITENLMIIFPGNLFIEFLHYMLSTVWVKKVAHLMNFLKERKDKNETESS